jgi:hypothetical protein
VQELAETAIAGTVRVQEGDGDPGTHFERFEAKRR